MNAAVIRALVLGCVAILILELPEVVDDYQRGDGFATVSAEQIELDRAAALEASAAEELVREASQAPESLASLLGAEAIEPVELSAIPGL